LQLQEKDDNDDDDRHYHNCLRDSGGLLVPLPPATISLDNLPERGASASLFIAFSQQGRFWQHYEQKSTQLIYRRVGSSWAKSFVEEVRDCAVAFDKEAENVSLSLTPR
jgi:hypothetical protein